MRKGWVRGERERRRAHRHRLVAEQLIKSPLDSVRRGWWGTPNALEVLHCLFLDGFHHHRRAHWQAAALDWLETRKARTQSLAKVFDGIADKEGSDVKDLIMPSEVDGRAELE